MKQLLSKSTVGFARDSGTGASVHFEHLILRGIKSAEKGKDWDVVPHSSPFPGYRTHVRVVDSDLSGSVHTTEIVSGDSISLSPGDTNRVLKVIAFSFPGSGLVRGCSRIRGMFLNPLSVDPAKRHTPWSEVAINLTFCQFGPLKTRK